jgi:tetratricopeptide (TPR) repeat protein
MSRLRTLVALVTLLLMSCRTAFGDAMQRGDELAALGKWDEAAMAYERAASLEPGDEEAQLKLLNARRKQAEARTRRGEELLAAGRPRDALVPFSEAVQLDPSSRRAADGLTRAKDEVLALAEQGFAKSEFKSAFELARAVLLVDPRHQRALEIESRARAEVTKAAVARADAHEKAGRLPAALVDYGEALEYVPEHAAAGEGAERVRARLREQITYVVALKNFDGDPSANDLGADVDAAVLARGIDARIPLRIVDRLDGKKVDYTRQGMRLGGMFQTFRHDRAKSQSSRSCDYVCGKEWVDNPSYATAEAEMRTSQSRLSAAEGRLAAAKSAISPAEQQRTAAETRYKQRQADADRAEQDLSRCRSSSAGQANACAAEQQRSDRAAEDERLAEQELRSSESALNAARSELSSAESDASSARFDAESKKRSFQSTPPKVERDKICHHTYPVETVVVSGEVSVMLRGESLYSEDVLLNRGVTGRVVRSDETFPPQPGRCDEVERGDPLVVPSEVETKKLVRAAAIVETQKELLLAFDKYRLDYLTRGDAALVDKKRDVAIDQLGRYLASAPGSPQGLEPGSPLSQAISKLAGAASVSDRAVRIGIWGNEAS